MHRRHFLQNSLLAMGAVTLGNNNLLKAMSLSPWNINMLTSNTGIFTEKGGTILFHFSKEGILVIDAQFPDSAQHLIDELKKRKDLPFHLLINTHYHGDHTSGNIAFKGLVNRVLAHENSLVNQKEMAMANKTDDQQLYPNQTFGKVWEERIGREKISLSYFGPAHTNGDAVIHLKHDNIAHVGDLVFNRRHPFVDRRVGANIQSWISVLDQTIKKFDRKTIFVCGHAGDNFDVKGNATMLTAFQDYLYNVLKVVGDAIRDGKSKEEILKITEVPGSPDWKSDGIERPLTAAYEELSAKA
jgi:cyclase